jgi:hypothetical protein
MGQYLAERADWPYYHDQGLDESGRTINDSDPSCGPIIASIGANSEGRNLQQWNRMLLLAPMTKGSGMEQLIGRVHRPGQKADKITLDIIIQHTRLEQHFKQSMRDCLMYTSIANQNRKLLQARVRYES